MRIIAEWDEVCWGGTATFKRCEAFEGETAEEIRAAILARAGRAPTQVVGLHNALSSYAAYAKVPVTVLAAEYPYGFADSPAPPPPPAPKGLVRRVLDNLRAFWQA